MKYGLGIGFVPEQFLEGEEDVREIPLSEDLPARDIILVRKKGHSLSLPAKILVDMIKDEYSLTPSESGMRG